MFRKFAKALPLLALAGLLAGCGMGSKSGNSTTITTAPASGTVIVTVNGQPITTGQVDAYIKLRTHNSKIQLTPVQRRGLAQELVQVKLAEQAAMQDKLQNQPDAQAEIALNNSLYLANLAVHHYIDTHQPSDTSLRQKYQTLVKAQSGEQYKARHILVKNKAEAQKIIDQLNKGADFATLAKKYSTDTTTAKQGGDLGWFKPEQMVPQFSAAVEKLKPGQYTKTPVQTQFGWHVIELEKERTAPPPSYTAMKPMLAQQEQQNMMQGYLNQLKSQATIVWKTPNPASAAKPATALPSATAAPTASAPSLASAPVAATSASTGP